jgi:hypothetical protein
VRFRDALQQESLLDGKEKLSDKKDGEVVIIFSVICLAVVFTGFGYVVGVVHGAKAVVQAVDAAVKSGKIIVPKEGKWNSQ